MSGAGSAADRGGATSAGTSAGAIPGLVLACQPNREGDGFAFPYTLTNGGTTDLYVMDALPRFDPDTQSLAAERAFALVIGGPGEDVTVGRFIPPPPTDRRVAVPVIPLARRLPAGGMLTARFTLAEPLAETTPYFPDLTLREYKLLPIQAVVVRIGVWLADTPGLAAIGVPGAPDLFTVAVPDPAGAARVVSRRFPTKGLQVFRRGDAFPRLSQA